MTSVFETIIFSKGHEVLFRVNNTQGWGDRMRQVVLPIKDDQVLKQVQDTLLHNFKAGRRNLTIFQVGKATLLRVSDVLRLKQLDIFDDYGAIKQNAYIHDKKTGKRNVLYLKPVEDDLVLYAQWLRQHKYYGQTEWLFPSTTTY